MVCTRCGIIDADARPNWREQPARLSCASDERSKNFFGEDLEAGEVERAERGHGRNVGSVAPACHQDAADARLTVTGIECVPAASEIGLEPCAEIHGRWIARHPDVPSLSARVTATRCFFSGVGAYERWP
jgi:hypothetical protein